MAQAQDGWMFQKAWFEVYLIFKMTWSVLIFSHSNGDPMRCSHADNPCYLDDD